MKNVAFFTLSIFVSVVAFAGPGDIHYVKTLQADVHVGPSSDSEKKFTIAIGRKLVEFDRKDGWIYAGIDKTGGKDGWVEVEKVGDTDPDGKRY